jgi:beta-lactamase superfamily II metal-dependent hydrolase
MSSPAANGASEACLYLHVFRVDEGLGNACVLEFPDHSCGVLDWGTQRDEPLEKALEIAGRGRLRFVAASHAHADHLLGMERLLRECSRRGIAVEKFVYPASTLHKKNVHLTRARLTAEQLDIDAFAIGEDSFLAPPDERQPPCLAWADDGSWDLRVLAPPLTAISRSEIKSLRLGIVPGNETSLVVLFRFLAAPVEEGVGRALLTGDATPATLSFARHTASRYPGLALENQAFLVPHHGSGHNLPSWLGSFIHGTAIISGTTGSPHHPALKVLQQLARWTCRSTPNLFCTDYADGCAQSFAARAAENEKHLVRPGSCFGDIVIRVPASRPAAVEETSVNGNLRRRFGHCGNP